MNNLNKILLEIDEKEFDFKIGDLKSFLDNEPQKYFNHDVVIETYQSLNIICENDFINNFEEIKDYFFSFINSYYHIVDIYNELDDISFDSEIKIKIYYLPIITQIIENVFSNFYRVVNYHLGTDKTAMMLNPLTKSLNNIFDSSFNEIDIDFRNAISHGKVSINGNIMFYTYSDKSVKPWRDKTEQINLNQIDNLTNKLIDTSSAVFLAFMLYLNKIDLFDNLIFKNKDDSYTNNELLKLYLKSEKAEIKYINTIEKPLNNQLLLEKNILNHYDSIFEVFIHFKNIQTKDDIQQVATNTILFLNKYYENYDKYIVNYSYDYSPNGIIVDDEVLDNITIDDDLLYLHTLKLSEYDFISEVDVNILGHIFENSLNELDEIKAQLAGETVDKTKTKRKKDGVFYTPKYITKYIVENTVGKLCDDKKSELEIAEDDYSTDQKRQKKTIKILLDRLTAYRNWLLQLTICDPACGSGAFLNQALDFLINEHKYIDEMQAKLFGDAMVLSDVEKSILENNLFGVDLNEESVEIAKLSLWLRTAQPNRKLNDLNNNLKCGNSLIDDVEIAGDKAFNWQQEFPQIFKEKNKKAFHITTAVHDSRTSERMIEFKVREKRDLGTNPYPNISYFTEEDEFVITQTIANIVKDDNLNVLAYNICADHIHLLLVCEEEEITKIVQKIKSITSKN